MAIDPKALLQATQEAVQRAASICAEDEREGYKAISNSFKALAKITDYVQSYDLAGQKYCPECGRQGISLDSASKTAANVTKVVNDCVRLLEFSKGNADSRAETTDGFKDLVQKLTSEQLSQVMAWMDENSVEKTTTLQ